MSGNGRLDKDERQKSGDGDPRIVAKASTGEDEHEDGDDPDDSIPFFPKSTSRTRRSHLGAHDRSISAMSSAALLIKSAVLSVSALYTLGRLYKGTRSRSSAAVISAVRTATGTAFDVSKSAISGMSSSSTFAAFDLPLRRARKFKCITPRGSSQYLTRTPTPKWVHTM